MSVPCFSLTPMAGDKESALRDYLSREGVTVIETELDGAWGYYDALSKTIFIQAGMTTGHRVATLLHEAAHHYRGDKGPQPEAVEARIDEAVARLLVDPREYAFWESQHGWHTGGIAHALELPRWVITAYRRVLERATAQSLSVSLPALTPQSIPAPAESRRHSE